MQQLQTCNAVCIWIQPHLFTFAQLKQLSKLFDLFVEHNTNVWLTKNSFPKSWLFANINMFKLFDLLKSRLKYTWLVNVWTHNELSWQIFQHKIKAWDNNKDWTYCKTLILQQFFFMFCFNIISFWTRCVSFLCVAAVILNIAIVFLMVQVLLELP